jgi:hypothetical protein
MHKMITPVCLRRILTKSRSYPCKECINSTTVLLASLRLFAYNSESTAEQVFMKSDIGEFYDKLLGYFLFKAKKSNVDCTQKPVFPSTGTSMHVVHVPIIPH